MSEQRTAGTGVWGMSGYQWTVVFAAWLGWGFDVFDGLLFNFIAPNCIPTLLGIPIGSPEASRVTLWWTGVLTSLLLLGWALGGILFGRIADRLGRTRTLMLTMLLYSLGTALCALAPNVWVLAMFRFVASPGYRRRMGGRSRDGGGSRPEKRRIEAGALLYTSAPWASPWRRSSTIRSQASGFATLLKWRGATSS
jgi:MFS family permease